jgi:hypothetical protein
MVAVGLVTAVTAIGVVFVAQPLEPVIVAE